MRVAAFAILALLTIPFPPVGAQAATPQPIAILTDPNGDVRAGAAGQGAANPAPAPGQLDLLAASVLEQATDVVFKLQVASLDDAAEPPLAESAFYGLHFRQGDVEYAVQVGRIKSQQTGVFASLSKYDPAEDRYYAVDYVPVTADPATGTFTVTVGRDLLVDSQGAKPYPGRTLSGFWAESQSFMEIFLFPASFAGTQATLRDRMPDAGNGTLEVPFLLGPQQTGSARLSSLTPTRQSNGEAGTFVFPATARNVGTQPERFRLSFTGLPQGWNVAVAQDLLAVPAGGAVDFPVLVTVPFTHKHGSFASFLLRIESLADPASHAELEMGIRYPKVPQPAGHHSTLWLHSAPFTDDPTVPVYALAFGFNVEAAWMNALEKDDGDRGVAVPADPPSQDALPGVPATFRWSVPLAPDLAIGLDFDEAGTGKFGGGFAATTPVLGATLSAELVRYVDSRFDAFGQRSGGNRTVLARAAPSPPQDLQPNAPVVYALDLAPTPEADLVPWAPKASLVLELGLTGNRPDTPVGRDPPKLLPGGALNLPLFEYHDPIDGSYSATPELSLAALSGQDRVVNPGKTAVYNVEARLSQDSEGHDVTLSLAGPAATLARIIGPERRHLAAGDRWNITVAVAVAPDASTKDVVDLVVQAQAVEEPALQALVRLYARVATTPDVPDQAGLAAQLEGGAQAKSPMPASAAVALALVASAFVARRRR